VLEVRSDQFHSLFFPVTEDVVTQWEFVQVFKYVVYQFKGRDYVICRSVLSPTCLRETYLQARKYKSNHSHGTDTLSLLAYVQQNVRNKI